MWRTTTTTFSPTGQPLTVTDAAGRVTRTCYDAVDRPTVVVDPSGRATRTVYNAAGQPVEVERWFTANVGDGACALTPALPSGQTTHCWRGMESNAGGLLAAELDARGNRTAFHYEGLGRLIITAYADGRDTHHLNNQRGEPVHFKTRSDTRKDYIHDQLGRIELTREFGSWYTPEPWPIGRITRTSYDLAGRTAGRDLSTQTSTTWDDSLFRDFHTYGYDGAGRATTDQWWPYPNSAGYALTYDLH